MSIIDDEFFVISSDNLSSVQNKLYGYAIVKNEILLNDVSSDLCGMGAYVQVYGDCEKIVIEQDFMGSYGLVLYESENFFAISNSFFKLEEYLRDNHHKMTLNMEYAEYYLGSNSSSHLPSTTLINEIRILPRNSEIIINKSKKSLEVKIIDFGERTVSIKSKEGIEILDNWFYRWIDLFRSIRQQTNNIYVDLTGGFDSRISMGICLSANIDLNNVRINSDSSQNRKEDFEIASELVNRYGLKLNGDLNYEKELLDFEDFINISEYVNGGFQKQHYLSRLKPKKYNFRITGHCGETIREYPHENPTEYITNAIVSAKSLDNSVVKSTESILNNSFKEIRETENIENPNSNRITTVFFNEGRNRIHFAKGFVSTYLLNTITLAPFTDPILHKLDYNEFEDKSILIHLIFKRFFHELIDFRFNNDKKLNEETLKICDEINTLFPFKSLEYDFIPPVAEEEIVNNEALQDSNKSTTKPLNKHEFMEEIFCSRKFEMDFKKYFSEDLYAKLRINKHIKYHAHYGEIYAAIEIIKVINDMKFCHLNQNFYEYLVENYFQLAKNPSIKFKADLLLKKYATARIDIKNEGFENSALDVLEVSDSSASIEFPKWFNDGKGCVIKSDVSSIDFKIRIINDGELSIKLRGINFKDKLGNQVPVYIDYIKLDIDNEEILKSNTLTSYNDVYQFKLKVVDSQILNVHIEWLPFNADSEYNNNEIKSLKNENKQLKSKLNSLKDENEELKNKLNEIYNSKSWKVISKLK